MSKDVTCARVLLRCRVRHGIYKLTNLQLPRHLPLRLLGTNMGYDLWCCCIRPLGGMSALAPRVPKSLSMVSAVTHFRKPTIQQHYNQTVNDWCRRNPSRSSIVSIPLRDVYKRSGSEG